MPIEIMARVEGDKELARDLARAPALVRRRAWNVLRDVAFEAMRRIKAAMPVDTGRARASWGQWDGSTGNPDASEADAFWQENQADLTITQGSNVEYVPALNEGHSQQAPKGFIDKIALQAANILWRRIDGILKDL